MGTPRCTSQQLSIVSGPVSGPVPVFGGCGFGCGGGFFVHKVVIQTIHQVNNCTGNGEDQKYGSDQQQQDQKGKQVVCLNTTVNSAGRSFGANGVGSGNLGNTGSGNLGQSDVPDNLLP